MLRIRRLLCENLECPIGLATANPRLSWRLDADSSQPPVRYQVKVQSGPEAAEIWDSGVTASTDFSVRYAGPVIEPGERAWWTVQVWDGGGNSAISEPSWWEPGIGDWGGSEWIGNSYAGGPRSTAPSPYLRKEFHLGSRPIRARLYVTALGLVEPYLNGKRATQDEFFPGWTDYRTRVQYRGYDVVELLNEGVNCIGAILGDGWYCGHIEWRDRQAYGLQPKLRARLMVDLADGSSTIVDSDGSWTTSFGPILESDMMHGEAYDARRELGEWCSSGSGKGWVPATTFEETVGIVPAPGPAVRVIQEISPIGPPRPIPQWPSNLWIFDLGQNMVGRIRIKVKAKPGLTIRIRCTEVLDAKGNLYREPLRTARATDYYTCKGDGEEIWESRFTFHGFRYVEIMGLDNKTEDPPAVDTVTGVVLHSEMVATGGFECSDPLVNQLQSNIVWGQKGNFLDVPTDCPQRDERLGWTGDAQVFVRTAAFNMDVAGFFAKWTQDLEDSQGERGEIPPVSPNTGVVGGDGGPGWADAFLVCPWTIARVYGDLDLLRKHYESMKAFVGWQEQTHRDFVRSYPGYPGFGGFGDWLSTNADTPMDLIGTAFFGYSADLMAKIADTLGHAEDAARYRQLFADIADSFRRHYVTPEGDLVSRTQTSYVLALQFGLLDEATVPKAVDALVHEIERRGDHLSTGFLGTPYLAHVLSDHGRPDVAFRLLMQKTYPSWLYPVTQGATTIWERWDGWTHDKGFQDAGMNSFNHYAYGAIGHWLYSRVAGIDLAEGDLGYRHLEFRPHVGGGLTHASAWLDSVAGRIEAGWRVEGGRFHYSILVPPPSAGAVYLPSGEVLQVGPGRHELECAL